MTSFKRIVVYHLLCQPQFIYRANLFDERFGDDSTEPWGRPSSDNNLDVAAVTPAYFRQQQQQVIQGNCDCLLFAQFKTSTPHFSSGTL